MKILKTYKKNKDKINLSIIIIIILSIIVGCIVFPTIFYDNWIWKYYWGPVVADAYDGFAVYNGVQAQEGYTIVSELTYGVILLIALYYIYRLLRKLKIEINWKFALALLPYIFFGPVSRVLEDTGYFNEPFVYWFISPLIYLQIAIYALFFIITAYYLQQKTKKQKENTTPLITLLGILILYNIIYTLIYLILPDSVAYKINPFIIYLLSFISFLPVIYNFFKEKKFSINNIIFSGGLLFLIPSLYLTFLWITGTQWDYTAGVRFDVFTLIIIIITGITAAVYLTGKFFSSNNALNVYKNPLNLAMIYGHLLDGVTSYISIYDPFGMNLIRYIEKHPASNVLLNIWPPLFPIVKFVLILFIIYIFDVYLRDELKDYINIINLLKIAILILGFSPGLRDILRVTMGV